MDKILFTLFLPKRKKLTSFHQPQFLLLMSLLLLVSCGGRRDNTTPPTPLVEFEPTLTLETVWEADAGKGTDGQYLKLMPSYQKGVLFTTSIEGRVTAFDFTNGERLWETYLEVPLSSGPGVSDNIVIVGSSEGDVIALSENEGTELWRVKVSSEILTTPQIQGNLIVLRTVDGKVFGLDKTSGSRLWIYERNVPLLSLRGTSQPLLISNVIIAGFDNGKLIALKAENGEFLWEYPVATPTGRTELERMVDIDANPLLIGNTVYVSSFQKRTIALDLLGMKLLWERDVASYTGLGGDNDTLYLSDMGSHIWAYDRFSGASLWKQSKLHGRHVTAPAAMGNYVIVGDYQGYLHWMNRADGRFVARHRVGNAQMTVAPQVVEYDSLVAYNNDGRVAVVKIKE